MANRRGELRSRANRFAIEKEKRFLNMLVEIGGTLQRFVYLYECDVGFREDLGQEILLGLWHAIDGFREDSSLRTFALRVATNVALRHQRDCLRRRKRDELLRSQVEQLSSPSLDSLVTGKQELYWVHTFLGRLGSNDRQLLFLYFRVAYLAQRLPKSSK